MNKNNIEYKRNMNKNDYVQDYKKTHYKQFNTTISISLNDLIVDYCKDNKISKADFLRLAVDKIINKYDV